MKSHVFTGTPKEKSPQKSPEKEPEAEEVPEAKKPKEKSPEQKEKEPAKKKPGAPEFIEVYEETVSFCTFGLRRTIAGEYTLFEDCQN